jgi:predicted RNA-binding protein with PUA-like domain
MGAACSNSNKIVQATVKKTGKRLSINADDEPDGVVCDPNSQYYGAGNVERMHEQLWKAVEANDRTAADKFLELNDIQESNLYDPFG